MRVSLRHKQQHLAVDVHATAGHYRVTIDDCECQVEAHALADGTLTLVVDGRRYRVDLARDGRDWCVAVGGEVYRFAPETGAPSAHSVASVVSPEVTAPMPGKVLEVCVKPGDRVESGDGLLILEAMKMENRLVAEAAGVIVEVRVAAGDMCNGGQVLMVVSYDA